MLLLLVVVADKSKQTNRDAELRSGGRGKMTGENDNTSDGVHNRFFPTAVGNSLTLQYMLSCSKRPSARSQSHRPQSFLRSWPKQKASSQGMIRVDTPRRGQTSCPRPFEQAGFSVGSRRQDRPRLQFKQVSDTALNIYFFLHQKRRSILYSTRKSGCECIL